MSLDHVTKILALNRKHVHIKDKENVNKILHNIINGGKDKLQVVFDYDMTLTKQHEDGKPHTTSFALFSMCKSVPKEYLEQEETMREKYSPIERDPHIPMEEKRKHLEEWWDLAEEALKGLKVSREEIDEMVAEHAQSLRDGTEQLFHDLDKHKVPILVFSAGLGDIIVSVLKHSGILYPTVKVISNFLKYNDKGVIQGYANKHINIFNKNEFVLRGTPYHDTIKDRTNAIVVGDSLGDAQMASGMTHCESVLKIGFLYWHAEKYLEQYMNVFDIVLEDDQTMDVLREIMQHVY